MNDKEDDQEDDEGPFDLGGDVGAWEAGDLDPAVVAPDSFQAWRAHCSPKNGSFCRYRGLSLPGPSGQYASLGQRCRPPTEWQKSEASWCVVP